MMRRLVWGCLVFLFVVLSVANGVSSRQGRTVAAHGDGDALLSLQRRRDPPTREAKEVRRRQEDTQEGRKAANKKTDEKTVEVDQDGDRNGTEKLVGKQNQTGAQDNSMETDSSAEEELGPVESAEEEAKALIGDVERKIDQLLNRWRLAVHDADNQSFVEHTKYVDALDKIREAHRDRSKHMDNGKTHASAAELSGSHAREETDEHLRAAVDSTRQAVLADERLREAEHRAQQIGSAARAALEASRGARRGAIETLVLAKRAVANAVESTSASEAKAKTGREEWSQHSKPGNARGAEAAAEAHEAWAVADAALTLRAEALQRVQDRASKLVSKWQERFANPKVWAPESLQQAEEEHEAGEKDHDDEVGSHGGHAAPAVDELAGALQPLTDGDASMWRDVMDHAEKESAEAEEIRQEEELDDNDAAAAESNEEAGQREATGNEVSGSSAGDASSGLGRSGRDQQSSSWSRKLEASKSVAQARVNGLDIAGMFQDPEAVSSDGSCSWDGKHCASSSAPVPSPPAPMRVTLRGRWSVPPRVEHHVHRETTIHINGAAEAPRFRERASHFALAQKGCRKKQCGCPQQQREELPAQCPSEEPPLDCAAICGETDQEQPPASFSADDEEVDVSVDEATEGVVGAHPEGVDVSQQAVAEDVSAAARGKGAK